MEHLKHQGECINEKDCIRHVRTGFRREASKSTASARKNRDRGSANIIDLPSLNRQQNRINRHRPRESAEQGQTGVIPHRGIFENCRHNHNERVRLNSDLIEPDLGDSQPTTTIPFDVRKNAPNSRRVQNLLDSLQGLRKTNNRMKSRPE